jgi:hypothetical protein
MSEYYQKSKEDIYAESKNRKLRKENEELKELVKNQEMLIPLRPENEKDEFDKQIEGEIKRAKIKLGLCKCSCCNIKETGDE